MLKYDELEATNNPRLLEPDSVPYGRLHQMPHQDAQPHVATQRWRVSKDLEILYAADAFWKGYPLWTNTFVTNVVRKWHILCDYNLEMSTFCDKFPATSTSATEALGARFFAKNTRLSTKRTFLATSICRDVNGTFLWWSLGYLFCAKYLCDGYLNIWVPFSCETLR